MNARIRLALRRLTARPLHACLSAATLGLGLGAAAAIASLVYGILLQPLPYPEPERLVSLTHVAPGLGMEESFDLSPATFLLYQRHARSYAEVGLHHERSTTLTGDGAPVRLSSAAATASLFRALGVRPLLGRVFADGEDRPGAPPVVLIGEGLWRERFGADSDVLERSLRLDGIDHRIVGVLPAEFAFPYPETELWIPLVIDPATGEVTNFSFGATARLRPEVPLEAARSEAPEVLATLPTDFPGSLDAEFLQRSQMATVVTPLRDTVIGDVSTALWLLLGSVALVLLVSLANVANLFLVRLEGRRREVAVRTALGASRRSLLADWATETLLLALGGSLVALALGAVSLRALRATESAELPRLNEVGLHLPVLGAMTLAALACALLLSLLPTGRFTGRLASDLREGAGRSSANARSMGLRNVLVVLQVALAVVLMVGSGLLARSYARLLDVDPGVQPAEAIAFRLAPPETRYAEYRESSDLFLRLLDDVRRLPGVEAAGAASNELFDRGGNTSIAVEDHPWPDGLPFVHAQRMVSEGWFAALGLPLLEGRVLERRDLEDAAPRVAVVSESFARRYWPQGEALGKRVQSGEPQEDGWHTIVGVVRDVPEAGLTAPPSETVYLPARPPASNYRLTAVVVRSDRPIEALVPSIRSAVNGLDPELPVYGITTLERKVQSERARAQFVMALLLLASAFALGLGAVGLFGVVSYVVSLRTGEFGVRMALGARGRDLRRLVLRQALLLAGLGTLIGSALGLVGSRLLRSQLYEVRGSDPTTYLSVALLVIGVGLVAAWLPAQRASRVSPLDALRYE